ncbi:YitT family protein [Yoonia sp.]|uniref:YitT family protein n=1 Tax=Yoonia sp. TaxID=2212373 RepID=UPI001A0347B0|nr:YitT family protein [Yoonia sp.]MBE0413950.1 YitT family protein [Yoonia sp.]
MAEKTHPLSEDAQAFVLSTALCGFGLLMLGHLGLITGQTAGLAVLVSYVTGWNFGAVFFVINLPFYVLAWTRKGAIFTLKSFIAVGMVSLVSLFLPDLIRFDRLQPLVGAVMAGAMIGIGLLVLFRHGGSLGGIGVLALYLQDKTGFRAGWTQLVFDVVLFSIALFVIGGAPILLSLAGAVATNLVIAVNHRPDRYTPR